MDRSRRHRDRPRCTKRCSTSTISSRRGAAGRNTARVSRRWSSTSPTAKASDSDEEELAQIAGRIRSLGTDDGRALLVNIHLASGDAAKGRIFLTDGETAYNNRYARLLYDISSPMPPLFDDAIRSLRGDEARGPFRGMCYNASITELLSILNVGSISVNLQ